MKRTHAFFLSALVAVSVSAAPAIDVAALKAYATKALPRCADEVISLQRVDEAAPAGFVNFALLQTSSDPTCGKKENLLYSPTTEQVLIGNVIPLPADNRSVDLRVTQAVSERLQVPVTT